MSAWSPRVHEHVGNVFWNMLQLVKCSLILCMPVAVFWDLMDKHSSSRDESKHSVFT